MRKESFYACLQRKLLRARSLLIGQISTIVKDFGIKVQGNLLIESLKSNLNESEARLQAVFQEFNDKIRQRFEGEILASKVESGKKKLEEIIPKEMALIKTLPRIYKNLMFDFNTGQWSPAALYESWVSESEDQFSPIEELLQNLEDMHRLILFEQPRFGNKSLTEYLISKDCYRYENRERKCSYHDCDDKYELRFLLNAEMLGWEWMRALSSAECIRQAKTERWRNDCFLEWMSCFMDGNYGGPTTMLQVIWFNNYFQQVRKMRSLDKKLFDKKSCDCQTNEFSKIVSSKGNQIEITCKRCPQGTYNLKMGADTCLRCPSHLSPTDTLWNTIGFSEQCWNSTSLKVNDHSESQDHKTVGKETKSENQR